MKTRREPELFPATNRSRWRSKDRDRQKQGRRGLFLF
jgi:hypothetical protein